MNTYKQKVYFFCDDYKTPFVINEINNLSNNFNKVVVVSLYDLGDLDFGNVERLNIDFSEYSLFKLIFKDLKLFFQLFFLEVIFNPIYFFYPKLLANLYREYLQCVYIKRILKPILINVSTESMFYTFWFNKWATVLAILVKEKAIDRYYSRVHGADLYEERVPLIKKLPFRNFQFKYVCKVYSVSKKGEKYLKMNYSDYNKKISHSYLGTKYKGENTLPYNHNLLTIVSCAKIRNIKRIHLLAEIVSEVDFPIKWIHIGDENIHSDDPTIKKYLHYKSIIKNKKNVEFLPTGDISNNDVMRLYLNTPINLFISLSETEGLPVSMMEALSFGIPILSTDVGGCSEIVTDESGILIDSKFSKLDIIKILKEFPNSSFNSLSFRKLAISFWQDNFDNDTNFNSFLNEINNSN